MNSLNTAYPTVATIIGCPEELKRTDGLLATPIVIGEEMKEPSVQELLSKDTSMIKDPVQKAVVDNILGNVSTKPVQEKHRCEICNIEVSARAALLSHLSGARHAKKMKEEVFDREPQNPYIEFLEDTKMYRCTLCNSTLNAKIQIIAHLKGSKHMSKIGLGGKEDLNKPALANNLTHSNPKPAAVKQSEHQTLVCAACNIYVNSQTQLDQHTSSRKHQSRVSNGGGGGGGKLRSAPYPVGRGGRSMGGGILSSGRLGHYSNGGGPGSSTVYSRRNNPQSSSPYRMSAASQSSYTSLSNSFVSSGVYTAGGGAGHSYPPHSYSQSYRHQSYPHTYG